MRQTLTVSLETGDRASIHASLRRALCQALHTGLMKSAAIAGREREKEGKREDERKELRSEDSELPAHPAWPPSVLSRPAVVPARGSGRSEGAGLGPSPLTPCSPGGIRALRAPGPPCLPSLRPFPPPSRGSGWPGALSMRRPRLRPGRHSAEAARAPWSGSGMGSGSARRPGWTPSCGTFPHGWERPRPLYPFCCAVGNGRQQRVAPRGSGFRFPQPGVLCPSLPAPLWVPGLSCRDTGLGRTNRESCPVPWCRGQRFPGSPDWNFGVSSWLTPKTCPWASACGELGCGSWLRPSTEPGASLQRIFLLEIRGVGVDKLSMT